MLCLSGFELYSRWVPLTKYVRYICIRAIQSPVSNLFERETWNQTKITVL